MVRLNPFHVERRVLTDSAATFPPGRKNMAQSKTAARAIILADTTEGIRILRPSLDDDPDGSTTLRGPITIESLKRLRFGAYQREQLPNQTNRKIQQAVVNGTQLPDITLGMRGDRFTADTDGSVVLLDPVYVIDGKQRVTTILAHLASYPADHVKIAAVVYFNTNQRIEQDRFHALGLYQTRIAGNVIARNMRDDVPLVSSLYGLSVAQKDSPVFNRVCWQQKMARNHLLSATTYLTMGLELHGHLAATKYGAVTELKQACSNLTRVVDIQTARENINTFWGLIDQSWGFRELVAKVKETHLHHSFLSAVVRILSDHTDFWDGNKLVISSDLRRKFKTFRTHAPDVQNLATATGRSAKDMLRLTIIEHLNFRARRKLMARRPIDAPKEKVAA